MQEKKGMFEAKAVYHEHRQKKKATNMWGKKTFLLIFWKHWDNFKDISERWEGIHT